MLGELEALVMWTLLLACNPDEPARPPLPAVSSSPDDSAAPTTPSTEPEEIVDAACEIADDNPLRARCVVVRNRPGPVTVSVSAPGMPERHYASDLDAAEHELWVWGLPAETEATWRSGTMSGTFVTGSLPKVFGAPAAMTTGTLEGADAVFTAAECSDGLYFLVVDGPGRIVWFERATLHTGPTTGYTWSQADRSFIEIGRNLLERHVSGERRLSLRRGEHYDDWPHHDVARWGPYTYLLVEREVDIGIEVFEGERKRGSFSLAQAFDLPHHSHANGVKVNEAGQIALSLRNYDSVVALDGDPASPGFLDVLWHAHGSDGLGLGAADFAPDPADSPLFHHQHNASFDGDRLWVFDNLSQQQPRALRMRMDEQTGALIEDGAWPVPGFCFIQGGAMPLEGGGVLATCADEPGVYAFRDGDPDPIWSLHLACDGPNAVTHALPVQIE